MLDRGLARLLGAKDIAEDREISVVYDDLTAAVFRCYLPFSEVAESLPSTCRWVPDYKLLRRWGLYIGVGIAGIGLVLSILIFIKMSPMVGTLLAALCVLAAPILAIYGWNYGPRFPWHEYRPFNILRRVTQPKKDAPPLGALATKHENGDSTVYLVPFEHSFLNLPSLTEASTDKEYTPFVVRASTLFKDSRMEDVVAMITGRADTWTKLKAVSIFGLILAEFVVMYLMFVQIV
jgi:hypothetical protein